MSRVRITALLTALVAVFAVSVSPASAAKEFIQKAAKAGNHGKALSNQVFKTKAGEVVCESLKSNGGSTTEKSFIAFQEVNYEKCKAFGFVNAAISPAQYKFNAQGKTAVLNVITIKASGCEVEVNTEGNQELSTNTFENTANGLKIKASQTGITYKVNKNGLGLCGTVGSAKNGEYKGEAETEKYAGEACVFVGAGNGSFSDSACSKAGGTNEYAKLTSYSSLTVA